MKNRLAILLLLAFSSDLFAASAPSAGTQVQQVPAAPVLQRIAPTLPTPPDKAAAISAAGEAGVTVSSLRFTGATRFSDSELLATTGFRPAEAVTVATLRSYATAITTLYRDHGYLLAQASLPAQDIVDGVVGISIVEGRYDKVELRNTSRLSDGLAQGVLDGLDAGDPILIAPLETRLLLLSDLAGVAIHSTLAPGASVGASDLIVDVVPGELVTGSVDADNAGSRYTGVFRSGATLNLNNPFGRGDVASLRAFTSWQGLEYGRASYQQKFGRADAGLAYTALHYELGHEFESLQAHGRAQIASVYARYPLQRSRRSSVYMLANFDAKSFRDDVDVTEVPTITRKHARVAMLSVFGDQHDPRGTGVTNYSLAWTSGRLDIRSPDALAADAASAHSDGHYTKLTGSLSRLQRLSSSLSLYAAFQGQLGSQNLDASEKLALGGANGVRAYAEGDVYVDAGHVATLELRYTLPVALRAMPGQLQLAGFVDEADGELSHSAWSAGSNGRNLVGAGLALNWFDSRLFVLKAYYARRVDGSVAWRDSLGHSRFGINAVKYF